MSRAKRWCFTLNNPTDEEIAALRNQSSGDDSPWTYMVFGREVGSSGTPHLQGFFILRTQYRLSAVRGIDGLGRSHLEVCRGTPQQAAAYCKKDGDYDEFGFLPGSGQGKRSDFERFREWVKDSDSVPTSRDVWETFPSLAARYPRAVRECIQLFGKRPNIVGTGQPGGWQSDLDQIVSGEPDDRTILFYVDEEGGKGKSWLTRYWFTNRDDIQRLSVGKRDDLAHAIDVTKKVFVFDIPRGQSEYLQYSILEQLKDQMLFSPKYDSTVKILPDKVHVIVFMNEEPDMTALTNDRYNITRI